MEFLRLPSPSPIAFCVAGDGRHLVEDRSRMEPCADPNQRGVGRPIGRPRPCTTADLSALPIAFEPAETRATLLGGQTLDAPPCRRVWRKSGAASAGIAGNAYPSLESSVLPTTSARWQRVRPDSARALCRVQPLHIIHALYAGSELIDKKSSMQYPNRLIAFSRKRR